MNIVIDTNRIIAALLKSNTTRKILFNNKFRFFAPDHVWEELRRHNTYFLKKTQLNQKELDIILSLFFGRICIVTQDNYELYYSLIDISDQEDIPFLACAKSIKAQGIWSHDPHLKEQTTIPIYTNIDMLTFMKF